MLLNNAKVRDFRTAR